MELSISTEALTRIFVFLLYVPIILISYWKLIPRLSPTAKRIASGFLAAQVLVIVLSLEIRLRPRFEWWLWHLNQEGNITAMLASMQLGFVSVLAMLSAWLAQAKPAWQRFYWLGIGLIFLYLGFDEFFSWKAYIPDWETGWALVGIALAGATITAAMCSRKHARIWHLCLLTGLSLAAIGGIVIDDFPNICTLSWLGGCLPRYIPEESLEFLGIWLVMVAILGQFSDAAPRATARVRLFLYILPALWIFLLFLHSLIPRLELQLIAQPAAVQFETGIHLHGYRIDSGEGVVTLQLYKSASKQDYMRLNAGGMGYSVHLVDQTSGDSVASVKYRNIWQGPWLFGPGVHIYRQRMKIKIPPETPVNRALWVVLTVWRKKGDEYVHQKILASDHQLLNDTQVILGELALPPS